MATKYQEQSTGFVPFGENPKIWIARTNDIFGGNKIYNTLEEFVQLHPNLMQIGMEAVVNQHERDSGTFPSIVFKLNKIPEVNNYPLSVSPNQLDESGNEIIDGNGDTIPAENFYENFWTISQEFEVSSQETVFEYAPDINGLKPPFPYLDNPDAESSWSETYNPASSKWLRSRNTDRQDINTGIYLDWSIPLPINGNFETGDYTQNLFRRSATTPQLPSGTTKDGLPNNNPSGWQDIPPTNSTDPLYEIRGQKDKYGNLKSAWIGPFLIPEDEDLIRYNSSSTPNPNTIVNSTTPATEGSQADLDLIAAGWVKTFDPTIHQYRAKRSENAPNDYTAWDVAKIAEESGEYIDRIYKLFPINQDFDNSTFITNNRPSGNDPIGNSQNLARNEGWSDVQQDEDESHINFYSEARKFIDGSLKTNWSAPKPFTGKDTYIDYIRSNGENNFKYTSSTDTTPDPSTIELTFFLFKGNNEIQSNLTYKWFKIYNNRAAITVNPDVDTPLAVTKSLTVEPSDVDTKAIFRCYATLAVEGGDDIIFIEEEPIVDITDGDDAKSLILSSDTPIILYDTSGSAFSVDTVTVRGFQNFLTGTTFYWYKDDGAGNWVDISANTDYTLTNQSLQIATSDLFNADGTKQNARFALSTSANTTDVEDNDEFYDVITLAKLSSSGVGAAGQDAYTVILSNEVDSAILNRASGLPQSGEITSSGTVSTLLNLYDGTAKLTAGTDYTISVASNQADITFDFIDEGDNYKIFVDTWTATTVRKVTCTITIDIVGVTESLTKNFVVTTNLDDAGAVIGFVDIASDSLNKTFSFNPEERRDIKLIATLDQNGSPITAGNFDGNVIWYFNGVQTNTNISGTNNSAKLVTRADVTGSLAVKAKITYNGQEYFTTPVNIDDITDSSNYILYHHFGIVPSEPIATPTKPADTPVEDFETDFNLTPSGTGYFREPGDKSYFYSIGQVEVINNVDTIVFNKAFRNRGEKGEQGPTPDFIVNYYKVASSVPTIVPTNGSRNTMINTLEWFATPAQAEAAEPIGKLYEATTTFNGSDINDLDANATNPWSIVAKGGDDGLDSWQPVFNTPLLPSGEAYVVEVIDWFGGSGTKPAVDIYLSASGYTSDINQATRLFPFTSQEFNDYSNVINWGNRQRFGNNLISNVSGLVPTPKYSTGSTQLVYTLESGKYYINNNLLIGTLGIPINLDNLSEQQLSDFKLKTITRLNSINIPGQFSNSPIDGEPFLTDIFVEIVKVTDNGLTTVGTTELTGKTNYNLNDIFNGLPLTYANEYYDINLDFLASIGIILYYEDNTETTTSPFRIPNSIGQLSYNSKVDNVILSTLQEPASFENVVTQNPDFNLLFNTYTFNIADSFTQSAGVAPTYTVQMEVRVEYTNNTNNTTTIGQYGIEITSINSNGSVQNNSGQTTSGYNIVNPSVGFSGGISLQPNETRTISYLGSFSIDNTLNNSNENIISGSINPEIDIDFTGTGTFGQDFVLCTLKSFKTYLVKN